MRIYVSTLERDGPSLSRVEQLCAALSKVGVDSHMGIDFENREAWHDLITTFDAMLVLTSDVWLASEAKVKQASEALRFGVPTYFWSYSSEPDPREMFGSNALVLHGTLEQVPEQITPPSPLVASARTELALLSLSGLSVGDAFGERFFGPADSVRERIRSRTLPHPPWSWTDDTAQARVLFQSLAAESRIEPDRLAHQLYREYSRDPSRGYGANMHTVLQAIGNGVPWKKASRGSFGGSGSYGNGGAMRVAPVGAYFSDDPARAAQQARISAQPTHAHPEGQTGAEAVALAAVWAARRHGGGTAMLEWVRERIPQGKTRAGLTRAIEVEFSGGPENAALVLGSGREVSAWDTVPFVIWCAAHYHHSYPEALWATVAGLGDRDTTCAMVGGIVALSATEGIPAEWLAAREPI